jgi:hypothetical protein
MANTSETPTPPEANAGAPQAGANAPPAILRSLSPRLTAALAAVMLAAGVAVGAAIGPAPSASFAGARLPQLLPSLLAAAGVGRQASAQPPAVAPQPTPSPATGPVASSAPAPSPALAPASAAPAPAAPSSPTPTGSEGSGEAKTLAPVTHVWLLELSGSGFASALAQPASAPYIDGQAIPAGTLLSGWSALAGSAFASEAALLASPPPQLVDTLTQPPCPEGVAGAQCAPGTPGELAAADAFLKAAVATITSTVAYREHGLILVTFASIVAGSASGLPAGSASATLTSQPPAGVLLISPFAPAGARSSAAFNPISPKQSVEKLLRR